MTQTSTRDWCTNAINERVNFLQLAKSVAYATVVLDPCTRPQMAGCKATELKIALMLCFIPYIYTPT